MERFGNFIAGAGWLSFYLFLIVVPLDILTHTGVDYWWPIGVDRAIKVLLYACPASMLSALITVKTMRRFFRNTERRD
jgi:hypothetical protein